VKQQVLMWLHDWFVSRGKIATPVTSSFSEVDYFDAEWLTSMEVVEFVTEIEQQFGMQFSDADLQDPRFATIGGLADLILESSTSGRKSI
jgi:acyl carrier protein